MARSPVSTPSVGDPITEVNQLLENDAEDFKSLFSIISSSDYVPNGSFENDTDSDGEPDSWVVRQYDGGSFGISSSVSQHGGKAFYATSPGGSGKGGARIETADYIPVSPNSILAVRWLMMSTPTNVMFRALVTYYKLDKSIITTHPLCESITNPTSWATRGAQFKTPDDTRWVKLFFDLGALGGFAGTQYLDRVEFFNPVGLGNRLAYTTPGTYSFTVPDNVVAVRILALGGGGAGGGGNTLTPQDLTYIATRYPNILYFPNLDFHFGGGGGGGGAFVGGMVGVIPGETIEIVVGAGGAGLIANNGGKGGDTLFGGSFIARGGAGGYINQANNGYFDGPPGAGGLFSSQDGSGLWGISGEPGAYGSKINAGDHQSIMSNYIYCPTGGVGGAAHPHSLFTSTAGSGGNINYTGLIGMVSQIGSIDARIVAPTAGSGYGAGGGGGALSSPGGNGSGGFLILEW